MGTSAMARARSVPAIQTPVLAASGDTIANSKPRAALMWVRLVLKAPFRAIRRACDSYERGMTRLAGSQTLALGFSNISVGYTAGYPQSNSLQSRSTSEDDHRELVRSASHSVIATRGGGGAAGPENFRRTQSAAVCRIDEDRAIDFGSADPGELSMREFPRSRRYFVDHRSCATGTRTQSPHT